MTDDDARYRRTLVAQTVTLIVEMLAHLDVPPGARSSIAMSLLTEGLIAVARQDLEKARAHCARTRDLMARMADAQTLDEMLQAMLLSADGAIVAGEVVQTVSPTKQ